MTHYILQVILCSALLLAGYKLLLARISLYRFSRYYLLMSMLLSLVLPLIPKSTPATSAEVLSVLPAETAYEPVSLQTVNAVSTDWSQLLFMAYAVITTILLIRFVWNFLNLYLEARRYRAEAYGPSRLVRLPGPVRTFSFFHFLFMGEADQPDEAILCHELAHIRQHHSLDLLVMELVLAFYWFNPVFYLYRQAIRLNHEFLADQFVLAGHSQSAYQHLLVSQAAGPRPSLLTSTFHYSSIKKRLIMMNKSTSTPIKTLALLAILPVLIASFLLFGQEIRAQEKSAPSQALKVQEPQPEGPGATAAEMKEYQEIVLSNLNEQGYYWLEEYSPQEIDRLKEIYMKMTDAQRALQKVTFVPLPGPLPQNPPTQGDLDAFQDSKEYGVWIDYQRVDNNVLADYKPEDFGTHFVSRLMPNAKNYGKHTFQVELTTAEKYEKEVASRVQREGEFVIKVPYIKAQ